MTPSRTTLREIVAYLGIAYGLALIVAVGLPDAHINLLLSVMVPTVTVGILTFTLTPRVSRRSLWRGIGLGRAGFRAWPAAIVLPMLLCAGAYGTALVIGAGRLHLGEFSGAAVPDWTANFVVSLLIGTVIILGEEIGWRGYLLPRFQQVTTRRRAAVATGFAHGCFHLPLILLATTYDTGVPRWVAAPVAVAVITAGGVFYAWLWDRAGTVWPVAIAHNVVNTVFDLGAASVVATSGSGLAYVAGETGFATLGVCVLAAVVLLRWARVWRRPVVREVPVPVAQAPVAARAA
ncbi:MAG TPA: type II CAAX endopeptidase family protein [Blastococcus sp.]